MVVETQDFPSLRSQWVKSTQSLYPKLEINDIIRTTGNHSQNHHPVKSNQYLGSIYRTCSGFGSSHPSAWALEVWLHPPGVYISDCLWFPRYHTVRNNSHRENLWMNFSSDWRKLFGEHKFHKSCTNQSEKKSLIEYGVITVVWEYC